ncbi:DUF6335 family protein [Egbenema bharatensis]|uniref:DUF6335 family protein n=1 Tax=Egbenema bharatensis TaxID=3463334 RepID=UPI003A867BDA
MLDKNQHSKSTANAKTIGKNAEELNPEPGSKARTKANPPEVESLESETGLEEVPFDQAVIDTVAVDDTDDNFAADDDGVVSEPDDAGVVSNLPQEQTETRGTGLQGRPSDRAGRFSRRSDDHFNNSDASPVLTGGDVDANYEQASAVGDEAVGGTAGTPDQDVVEELAAAVGVEIDDHTDVRINELLEERDDRRWELDPKSSEDYPERKD